MGAWGAGLYADDFALDLKPMIGALCRLPHDADKIVDLASALDPAADDPVNEDHTTFWLVLADQLWKKGVVAERAFARARDIIRSGADIDRRRALSMAESDLRKRAKMLASLDAQLAAPPSAKRRSVLQKPQPLIVAPGEILAYPTAKGQARNPYMSPAMEAATGRHEDGEGAILVVAAGHAFGYLAWYAIWPLAAGSAVGPMSLATALSTPLSGRWEAGTCTKAHFQRIGFRRLGLVDLPAPNSDERAALDARGLQMAVNDISMANSLGFRLDAPAPAAALTIAEYAGGRSAQDAGRKS